MKARESYLLLVLMLLQSAMIQAQPLKPYFDKAEYIETLKINYKVHIDVNKWQDNKTIPEPAYFKQVYRSQTVGFDNLWDLWKKNDRLGLIAVRGTTQTGASFLANLYAAMVPAKGSLKLSKDFTFDYHLADHPNAAVHVGWLVSMAYLSKDIITKVDSCYKTGMKEFILTGHSQGGGIVFLLKSHLENLKRTGRIPADLVFKTYCSAGPKPGNLFFAYEYEDLNRDGWACNVVNTADWVPDVPFTVQTVDDFTSVNPFRGAKAQIKKQKFPKNMALKYAYNQMSKPSYKAQKNYQKFLGKMVSQTVKKQFPEFEAPVYFNSNYYVRTGTTIPLYARDDYFKLFSNDPSSTNIWQHHLPAAYLHLAEKLK
jgi:hypothetical protein